MSRTASIVHQGIWGDYRDVLVGIRVVRQNGACIVTSTTTPRTMFGIQIPDNDSLSGSV